MGRVGVCIGVAPLRRDLFLCRCIVLFSVNDFMNSSIGPKKHIGKSKRHDYLMCSIADWVSVQLFGEASCDFLGSSGGNRSEILSLNDYKKGFFLCINNNTTQSLSNKMEVVFSKPRNFIGMEDRFLGFAFVDCCASCFPKDLNRFLDHLGQGAGFRLAIKSSFQVGVDEFFANLVSWASVNYK